jgi:hypothetical protein
MLFAIDCKYVDVISECEKKRNVVIDNHWSRKTQRLNFEFTDKKSDGFAKLNHEINRSLITHCGKTDMIEICNEEKLIIILEVY